MSQEILKNIINEFNSDNFIRFFRAKNRAFAPRREELSQYNDVDFKNEGQNLIICAFEVQKALSERSGKKAQYKKAKKIFRAIFKTS